MELRVRLGLVAFAATLATSADVLAERVAVEANVGARPSDAERVLAPLRPVLERHGFVVDPTLLRKRFASHAWHSGGSGTVGPAIFKDIETGIAQFSDVKVSAAQQLAKGLSTARANPIAWANEPKYREEVLRGFVYYALALELRATDSREKAKHSKGRSQSDLLAKAAADDTARDEAMDELIRSSPNFAVSSDKFGSEGEALFEAASKRARNNGGGSLELEIDDPNVVVYVNEVVQPHKTTLGNLTAGAYRVLVVSSAESHEYSVDVLPNKRSRFVVKWELDSIFNLTGWVGLAYRTESDRKREEDLMSALTGTSGSVDVAATLTAKASGVVEGQSYDVRKGKPIASCTLTRNSQAPAVEVFARCLAGESDDASAQTASRSPASPSNEGAVTSISTATLPTETEHTQSPLVRRERPTEQPAAALPRPSDAPDESTSVLPAIGVAAWLVGGAGIATGATILNSECNGPSNCGSRAGFAMTGAGVAVFATGFVLWRISDHRRAGTSSPPSITVTPMPGGGTAAIGWTL